MEGRQINPNFRNYQTGFSYHATPSFILGPGYGLTTLGAQKFHQLNLTADYFFSVRTDVYAQAIIQHATGEGAHADVISMVGSSNGTQAL
jgi:general bacterial porin, GBP family